MCFRPNRGPIDSLLEDKADNFGATTLAIGLIRETAPVRTGQVRDVSAIGARS
jgi:hypothetical protein